MKRRVMYRIISGLLALVILLQPFTLFVRAQQLLNSQIEVPDRLVQAEGAGVYTTFLPVMATLPGPPDFEITSPEEGWTVSGMLYLAAQPRNPETVTSVSFLAGNTPLGTDNTPADGFRVFLDASTFPAGNLTLTAVGSGPNGQASKSVTVNVVPDPPSSGTIGSQGGVLDSEIGSIITVPPGALPDGTTLAVDELTQEEVTAQNGIEWEAMGVTFLGAQTIQTTAPFAQPYRVASADFGNRVQPGQAVVNYQIFPDADGDGVDEIVVVNTATVAPNNDVISDPIPQILLDNAVTVSTKGNSTVQGLGGTITGPPGTFIEIDATGFNPYSVAGNTAVFHSQVDNTEVEMPGILSPDLDEESADQTLSAIIPMLPAGPATLVFRNDSTGDTTEPLALMVQTPTPITRPADEIINDFFTRSLASLNEIEDAAGGQADLSTLITELAEARFIFEQLSEDTSPETQQFLVDMATIIENSGILESGNSSETGSLLSVMAGCFTKTQLKIIRTLILVGVALTSLGCALLFTPLAGGLCAAVLTIVFGAIDIWFLGDAECPPTPPQSCPPSQAGGGGTTGMGSAPPPGGNGCGGAGGGGGSGFHRGLGAAGIMVKVFSAGSPIAFSGMTDAGGYFFVPLIPAGEPFTAVAYDLVNNETRIMEGIGPQTGDRVFIFFNFYDEQSEIDTIYWDGEGDGTSWHDPFNWNPNLVPGPTQDVIIDVPGNVTVVHSLGNDAVLSLHSEEAIVLSGGTLDIGQNSVLSSTLTLTGGSLTGVGDVTVNGLLTWNYGSMSGPGATTANGGLTISGNYGRTLDERTLENGGTAVFQAGTFTVYNGATITNRAGATFDIQGDHAIYNSTGGGTFHNLGTLTKSAGSSSATIYIAFNNDGAVSVQAGTLSLNGGGNHTGSFQGNSTLAFAGGTHNLNGSLTTTAVQVSGGTLAVNGSYDVTNTTLTGGTFTINTGITVNSDTFTFAGGTLTGNGDVAVSGLFTWNYGTMSGIGTTLADGGILFTGNTGRTLDGRTLENGGTAVFQDGTLTAYNGALLHNLSGSTWEFQGDDNLYSSTGGATFQNDGTVTKSAGSGTMTTYIAFHNDGTVSVQAGTFSLNGGGNHTGSFQGTATLAFGSGTHNFNGTLTGLDVQVGGGTVSLNGSYNAADTTVTGGTLSIGTGITADSDTLTMSGGTLTGNGDVVVSGLFTWNYGTMSGIGTTLAGGGILFSGNTGRTLDGRTLENGGTAVFQDGTLTAYNAAVLHNLTGATWEFQGDDNIYSSTGGATFQNDGTVVKSAGSGTMTIFIAFHNDGTVEVESGTLSLNGGGSHDGSFQGTDVLAFGAGSHTLNGTVTGLDVSVSGGTVSLNGSYNATNTTTTGGTLSIGTGITADSDTLTMSGGTLTGNGEMVVSGLFTWNYGTMSGTGSTTAEGGILFSGNFGRTLDGRTLENGGTAVFQDGSLTAYNGAMLHNLSGSTWDFTGDDTLFVSTGGATFQNDGSLTKSAGTGVTAVNLAFTNAGNVSVQSGELRFGGSFTQVASGILHVQIGGLTPITQFDQYNITGAATLGGTLNVTLAGGYVPDPGDSFEVVTFASRTGQFANVNGNGQAYTANYGSTDVTLIAQ